MTWRNTIWQGGYRWLLLGLLALLVGILIAIHTVGDEPLWERIIATVLIVIVLGVVMVMHNWITVKPGELQVGFWPSYLKTMPMRDIRRVRKVDIRPYRHYGGLGLKGLSGTSHGLLPGGFPTTGLMFETIEDRRYVVTFRDLDPIIGALASHGCTLSADVND
jgi:hypothetical protein